MIGFETSDRFRLRLRTDLRNAVYGVLKIFRWSSRLPRERFAASRVMPLGSTGKMHL
jgi:hypothetical protein